MNGNSPYTCQKNAEQVEESHLFFVQGRLDDGIWEDHVFFTHVNHENGFLTPDMAFDVLAEAPRMEGYYLETRVIHRSIREKVVVRNEDVEVSS